MSKKNPTWEEVNESIDAVDLAALQAPAAKGKRAPADLLESVRPIYAVARPVLSLLQTTTFIPRKWRDVIAVLVSLLDRL